jgi:uncharacterized membrane protein YgcG
MTDYSKQTVAQLRQLLKDRSIPSTGLTRKAQIVEKLAEYDTTQDGAPAEVEATPTAVEPDVVKEAQDTPDPAPAAGECGLHLRIGAHNSDENKDEIESDTAGPVPTEESELAVESQPRAPIVETPIEAPLQEQDMSPELVAPIEEVAQPAPKKASAPAENVTIASEEQPTPTVAEPTPEPETQPTSTVADPTPEPEATQPSQIDPPTQTTDVDMFIKTPSPDPNEKPSVEKTELLPIPEGSVSTTAEISRLNTEELEADTRKRKRRSGSPELATQDIKAKKPRPSQDAAPEVHLKEDEDVVMEQRQPEVEPEAETMNTGDKTTNSNGHAESREKEASTKSRSKSPAPDLDTSRAVETRPAVTDKKEKAPRGGYKALFEPAAAITPVDLVEDDRPKAPALHSATSAIYIRNFMRPLKPEPLRAHLISLATPPAADSDPTILKTLFLDAMKTHALVLFDNTKAASRVRASLHGSIWPAEGNRKELWVDFVPSETVEEWIQTEEDALAAEKAARAARAPIAAKRFEVVYPESEEGVRAVFQEVGASLGSIGGGAGSAPLNAPRGPKSNLEQRKDLPLTRSLEVAPTTDASVKKDLGLSFQTLDSLFESTVAKPKLYFLPVSDERSDVRLDELDKETSRDWRPEDRVRGRGRGRLDEKVKISFDEEDRLVETGPDHGPWAEDTGGARGGRGGRGGFRGGYRGDSFRGGGGGVGFRGAKGHWRG